MSVDAVVTGDGIRDVREAMILRAYETRAKTGMNLTRAFAATISGFNDTYGHKCRTWDQVAETINDMRRAAMASGTLGMIREILAEYREDCYVGDDWTGRLEELASLMIDLDTWMSTGGALPTEWRKAK